MADVHPRRVGASIETCPGLKISNIRLERARFTRLLVDLHFDRPWPYEPLVPPGALAGLSDVGGEAGGALADWPDVGGEAGGETTGETPGLPEVLIEVPGALPELPVVGGALAGLPDVGGALPDRPNALDALRAFFDVLVEVPGALVDRPRVVPGLREPVLVDPTDVGPESPGVFAASLARAPKRPGVELV